MSKLRGGQRGAGIIYLTPECHLPFQMLSAIHSQFAKSAEDLRLYAKFNVVFNTEGTSCQSCILLTTWIRSISSRTALCRTKPQCKRWLYRDDISISKIEKRTITCQEKPACRTKTVSLHSFHVVIVDWICTSHSFRWSYTRSKSRREGTSQRSCWQSILAVLNDLQKIAEAKTMLECSMGR